jgi:hypothetical protein
MAVRILDGTGMEQVMKTLGNRYKIRQTSTEPTSFVFAHMLPHMTMKLVCVSVLLAFRKVLSDKTRLVPGTLLYVRNHGQTMPRLLREKRKNVWKESTGEVVY